MSELNWDKEELNRLHEFLVKYALTIDSLMLSYECCLDEHR